MLAVREAPLSEIHLENMLKLSRMGAVMLPPVPAFYNHPRTIDDVVDHTVARMLDSIGLEVPRRRALGRRDGRARGLEFFDGFLRARQRALRVFDRLGRRFCFAASRRASCRAACASFAALSSTCSASIIACSVSFALAAAFFSAACASCAVFFASRSFWSAS